MTAPIKVPDSPYIGYGEELIPTRVQVTDADLFCSLRREPYKCVIHNALARIVNIPRFGICNDAADTNVVRYFAYDDGRVFFYLPSDVANYIEAFDAGAMMIPTTFIIEIPRKYLK